eukprot:1192041-Prorocentrum_minimum.AAC.1
MLGGSNTPGCPVHGFSHRVLLGKLPRLAGADTSIFLNKGSRFDITLEECKDIAEGCRMEFGRCPPCFPCPAGDVPRERERDDQ